MVIYRRESRDPKAIHDNEAGEINAITDKAAPSVSDILLIEDAAASYVKKKVSVGNLPGGAGVGSIGPYSFLVYTSGGTTYVKNNTGGTSYSHPTPLTALQWGVTNVPANGLMVVMPPFSASGELSFNHGCFSLIGVPYNYYDYAVGGDIFIERILYNGASAQIRNTLLQGIHTNQLYFDDNGNAVIEHKIKDCWVQSDGTTANRNGVIIGRAGGAGVWDLRFNECKLYDAGYNTSNGFFDIRSGSSNNGQFFIRGGQWFCSTAASPVLINCAPGGQIATNFNISDVNMYLGTSGTLTLVKIKSNTIAHGRGIRHCCFDNVFVEKGAGGGNLTMLHNEATGGFRIYSSLEIINSRFFLGAITCNFHNNLCAASADFEVGTGGFWSGLRLDNVELDRSFGATYSEGTCNWNANFRSSYLDCKQYNPMGLVALPVSGSYLVDSGGVGGFASGTTYTNVGSPKDVYITGGTVSSITKNGTQVFTSTERYVHLYPRDTISVTWSDPPTINVFRV